MKKSILLLLLICLFFPGFSQSKLSPYTRLFLSELSKAPQDTLLLKTFQTKSIGEKQYIKAYIHLKKDINPDILEHYGVLVNMKLDSLISAQIPVDNIETVCEANEVKYIQISPHVSYRMNLARTDAGVNKLHSGTDLSMPFTGKDVVVGIIDSGFQYDHINFYNTEGTELRIKRVWDQNGNKKNLTGFNYGTEYKTQTEITGARFDNYSETHGSHVTGIATGADKSLPYYGVAGDADIVLVSMSSSDNSTDMVSLSDGIKYIYDYAESVKKPCVINMSLGTHSGPHDGTSTFDQVCDKLQGDGRLLVGAAGNEGNLKLHIGKTFSPSDQSLTTSIYFYSPSVTGSFYYMNTCDIWGEEGQNFQVQLFTYNSKTGVMTKSDKFSANETKSSSMSLSGITGGSAILISGIDKINRKPNIYLNIKASSLDSYYAGLIITATSGTVHAWANDAYGYFSNRGIEGWTDGNTDCTVGEIGGTGKQIISVGAYATRTGSYASQTGMLAGFSSKGPTADGRIKPDITAPGNQIISSYSNASGVSGASFTTTVNGKNYKYGYMSGTSMATPYVTGVLATWLQAYPDLSPDNVREILANSSRQDGFTGDLQNNYSWGFGKIDAWNGLKECIRLKGNFQGSKKTSDSLPAVSIYSPQIGVYRILFGQEDTNVRIGVYNTQGKLIQYKIIPGISIADEITISLNDEVVKGFYIIQITGKNIHRYFKVVR